MRNLYHTIFTAVLAVLHLTAGPALAQEETPLEVVAAHLYENGLVQVSTPTDDLPFDPLVLALALENSAIATCTAATAAIEETEGDSSAHPACVAAEAMTTERWEELTSVQAAAMKDYQLTMAARGDLVVSQATNALVEMRDGSATELADRVSELEEELRTAQAALADARSASAEQDEADAATERQAELDKLARRVSALESELAAARVESTAAAAALNRVCSHDGHSHSNLADCE